MLQCDTRYDHLCGRSMKGRKPSLIVACLACLTVGCNTSQPTPQSRRPSASPYTNAPHEMSVDDSQVTFKLSDFTLERDPATSSTGSDLRPFWVVSGRIFNSSQTITATSVRLKLIFADKESGHDLDSAVVNVQQEIPPLTTVSFRRKVQLMLPPKGWAWVGLTDGATVR